MVWKVVPINILKETTDVLKQVEDRSGTPVAVMTDPSLPTFASIKIAKGSAPVHVLTYNPTKPGMDYHVAYQCGFVLRLFENSPEERFEFAPNDSRRVAVQKLLTEEGGMAKKLRLPKAA